MYNINRRKFLGLFGCGCGSMLLNSCTTVPITERKQLSIIPESRINRQAAAAYEDFRKKTKLINEGPQLNQIKKIGKKMEKAVTMFFTNQQKEDPTKNFEWDYILVDNDKIVNVNNPDGILNNKILFGNIMLPISTFISREVARKFNFSSDLKIKEYLFLGSTGILRECTLSKLEALVPVAFTKLPIFNFDPSLR